MQKNWIISNGMVEVHFDELIEKRDLSICIRIEDKKYWLPLSQIDYRDWSNIVEIPPWLAEQKGLI
jgi:hypothetical protein